MLLHFRMLMRRHSTALRRALELAADDQALFCPCADHLACSG
jgi:hypothetical protein